MVHCVSYNTKGRQIAGSFPKSVRHGIFIPYDHIHVFQWSVLLGEFFLFILFNHFPLCIADPNNSGMWIGNDKAEYLQFSHNNDLNPCHKVGDERGK